jgi:hypothetical protein
MTNRELVAADIRRLVRDGLKYEPVATARFLRRIEREPHALWAAVRDLPHKTCRPQAEDIMTLMRRHDIPHLEVVEMAIAAQQRVEREEREARARLAAQTPAPYGEYWTDYYGMPVHPGDLGPFIDGRSGDVF